MNPTDIKHTPGPWRVVELNSAPNVLAHAVATHDYEPVASHMTLPDAKLIAAAPELLEALKNLREAVDKITYVNSTSGGRYPSFIENYDLNGEIGVELAEADAVLAKATEGSK